MLNENQKNFRKLLEKASGRYFVSDVFSDAVHMMALSLWKPFAGTAAEAVESEWASTRSKYNEEEYGAIVEAFSVHIDDLEIHRHEFLGGILESLNANAVHNGQFLTPESVARLMGQICGGQNTSTPHHDDDGKHRLITLSDPACGASVLMIEQAEELLQNGVPQSDILIDVGDIDRRAVDMSYVELTLLGYAAIVRHRDSLAMKDFSPPMFTAGYFLHGIPMRKFFAESA